MWRRVAAAALSAATIAPRDCGEYPNGAGLVRGPYGEAQYAAVVCIQLGVIRGCGGHHDVQSLPSPEMGPLVLFGVLLAASSCGERSVFGLGLDANVDNLCCSVIPEPCKTSCPIGSFFHCNVFGVFFVCDDLNICFPLQATAPRC